MVERFQAGASVISHQERSSRVKSGNRAAPFRDDKKIWFIAPDVDLPHPRRTNPFP
jgi:hypothetical protein